MVSTDVSLIGLVGLALVIIVASLLLRFFKQPHLITYIIAGVLAGPSGFGLIQNEGVVGYLGTLGLVILSFFIGMEVSLPKLVSNWRITILGTLAQIVVSVLLGFFIGSFFEWSLARSVLIGFVISMSSTAVVLKILESKKQIDTKLGQNILGILLVQDLAVVPMLIILGLIAGENFSVGKSISQIVLGVVILFFFIWFLKRRASGLKFKFLANDKELQVFVSLAICFGFSVISESMGLSAALGAFIAGIVVSSTKEMHWVSTSLDTFRIVFVAMFFVSVGLLIDLGFFVENILTIVVLVFTVFLLNTLISAIVFRSLNLNLKESIYAGSLLAQIGEFGLVLAAAGLSSSIISDYGYQITVAIIAVSLLLSPFWVSLAKKFIGLDDKYSFARAK